VLPPLRPFPRAPLLSHFRSAFVAACLCLLVAALCPAPLSAATRRRQKTWSSVTHACKRVKHDTCGRPARASNASP